MHERTAKAASMSRFCNKDNANFGARALGPPSIARTRAYLDSSIRWDT